MDHLSDLMPGARPIYGTPNGPPVRLSASRKPKAFRNSPSAISRSFRLTVMTGEVLSHLVISS